MVIIVDSVIRSRSRWQDTSLSRALSEYSWCKSRPWDASTTRALVDTSLLWFARVHFLICGLLVCLWQVKTYHVMSRHVLSFSSSIFLHKWLIVGQHRRRWWTELSLSMTRRKPFRRLWLPTVPWRRNSRWGHIEGSRRDSRRAPAFATCYVSRLVKLCNAMYIYRGHQC